MATRFRRTRYFIDRGLQLRFARFVVVFVFIASAATALTVFFTTFSMLGEKLADVYPQGRLVAIFRSVYIAFFIDLAVILPFIFWGSILFSHRIAGPMPKIYRALKAIGDGDYNINLVLRKHDELKELADGINEMARKLKERESVK